MIQEFDLRELTPEKIVKLKRIDATRDYEYFYLSPSGGQLHLLAMPYESIWQVGQRQPLRVGEKIQVCVRTSSWRIPCNYSSHLIESIEILLKSQISPTLRRLML